MSLEVTLQLNPKYTKNIVKHGDASIMVWGCFTASVLGPLVKIEDIMNGEIYRGILRHLENMLIICNLRGYFLLSTTTRNIAAI